MFFILISLYQRTKMKLIYKLLKKQLFNIQVNIKIGRFLNLINPCIPVIL